MTAVSEPQPAAGYGTQGALPGQTMRWWRGETVQRLLTHRMFMVGATLFTLVLLATLLAPWVAGADPLKLSMKNRFQPPNAQYWFGTDNLGRDMFSRVLHGGQVSLLVGFVVVIVNAVFGVGIGAVAGYFRRLDNFLMRAMDAMMAFPAIMLALGIAAALGPSLANAMIALAVVAIPRNARLVRATFLVIREMPYVEAAVAAGARAPRIILTHILPNCMAPLVVALTFVFAYAVLAEAILSFLGLGTPPPAPSWGGIIAEGRHYMRDAPWIVLIPGTVLALTVLSLNLLGDGLRDVLDPKLKVQQA
jgi:peptide/nickel transport system permease protein